jgi:hypothetical protein
MIPFCASCARMTMCSPSACKVVTPSGNVSDSDIETSMVSVTSTSNCYSCNSYPRCRPSRTHTLRQRIVRDKVYTGYTVSH